MISCSASLLQQAAIKNDNMFAVLMEATK